MNASPSPVIDHVAIEARADGSFLAHVSLAGPSAASTNWQVEAQIQTLEGTNVSAPFQSPASTPLRAQVDSPDLWTAETPNLYCAEFRLKQNGQIIHRLRQTFGFRTVEVRPREGLYLNGQKLILRGIRQAYSPAPGPVVSDGWQGLDVNIIKDANIDTVWITSQHPDDQFLGLCDELGLYVVEELPSRAEDHSQKFSADEVGREENHPCILFWSHDGENGLPANGPDLDLQHRPIFPGAAFAGLNITHFETPASEETASGCESGPISGYWDTIAHRTHCLGDIIIGYLREPRDYYMVKESWSPIQAARETNGWLRVENHFNFTDASDCSFHWQLRRFATPLEADSFTVIKEGDLDVAEILPGTNAFFQIPEMSSRSGDALALRVEDPSGRELWTWVWPLGRGNSYRLTQEPAEHHAIPSENGGVISITTGDFSVNFSKDTGLLLGAQRGAQRFSLANGPRLAAGTATLKRIHYDDDGPDAFVSAKYDGDLKSVFWRVNGNGWVNCEYVYRTKSSNDFAGVLFDYPEARVIHKRWLGEGPYPVWRDRTSGLTTGVWEADLNQTFNGVHKRGDAEFKGVFAGVRWLKLKTAEGDITILNNSSIPYLQLFTQEAPAGRTASRGLPCGLAFLNALSAPENPSAGNQSESSRLEVGDDGQESSGSVSFYFGTLPMPPSANAGQP